MKHKPGCPAIPDDPFGHPAVVAPCTCHADHISTIEALQREVETLRKQLTNQSDLSEHPASCPITGKEFFMVIEHPELGDVATYGGPFDSYTIPAVDADSNGELRCERYDHDRGEWIEGGEPTGLYLTHEESAVLEEQLAHAKQENERLQKELRQAERDAHSEGRWQERQGDDYGTY